MTYIGTASTAAGLVRAPRCWVQIGEAQVPAVKVSVTRKSTRNADTFSAELAITATTAYGFDMAAWADWDPSQDVSILISTAFDQSDVTTMVAGKIDLPVIKCSDMMVTITARDKSASLTEKRRNQKFLNQKSSEGATQIAQDNGLNPVVVDSGDFSGKLYTDDTAHLVLNRTDYETMNRFAEREGFRWYVEGDNLYFEPKTSDTTVYPIFYCPPGTAAPYAVGNCTELTLSKNSTAARPHNVNASGWHHGKKKLYKATAAASGSGDPVDINLYYNGNTQDQLQKKAAAHLKDRIRHELSIEVQLPGDLAIDPRMQAGLTGTGTIFDQTFDIDTIEFEVGWDDGFDMTVTAKAAKQGRTNG